MAIESVPVTYLQGGVGAGRPRMLGILRHTYYMLQPQGYAAFRHTHYGSWLVQAVHEVKGNFQGTSLR